MGGGLCNDKGKTTKATKTMQTQILYYTTLYCANHTLQYKAYANLIQMLIQSLYKPYTNLIQLIQSLCIQSSQKAYTKLVRSLYKAHEKLIQSLYKVYTNLIQSLYKAYAKLIQTLNKACTKLIQSLRQAPPGAGLGRKVA